MINSFCLITGQRVNSEIIKCGTQLCRPVTGIFTKNPVISGYTHVTTIPSGASNITITELKSSPNLLGKLTYNVMLIVITFYYYL